MEPAEPRPLPARLLVLLPALVLLPHPATLLTAQWRPRVHKSTSTAAQQRLRRMSRQTGDCAGD